MTHKPWQATITCGAALVAAAAAQTAIRPPAEFTAALGPATVDAICFGATAALALGGVRAARALGRTVSAVQPTTPNRWPAASYVALRTFRSPTRQVQGSVGSTNTRG